MPESRKQGKEGNPAKHYGTDETPELTVRVAGQIREWRKYRRLTQKDLSLSIGQTASYIATIECLPRMPSFLAGMRICRKLGIAPEELLKPLPANNKDDAARS